MKNYLNRFCIRVFVLAILLLPALTVVAQCPMCKLNAENSDVRAGLNSGILYLLAAPILLMGGAYAYWYFNRKKYENW